MKKKTFFKILTICVILVSALLVINTHSYANITETTNTGKITLTGIEAGVKVSAYQLTTVDYDYVADQPKAEPYKWVESVKTWIGTNYPDYTNPEKFYEDIQKDATGAKVKTFYSKLSAAIKGGLAIPVTKEETATGTATYPVTPEKLSGSVNFENCEMGTYLILIENGYLVYTPSVVNLTPEFNNTTKEWQLPQEVDVQVKSTKPQVKKTVTDLTKVKDNFSTIDEIQFTIISDVPTYLEGSLSKKYNVMDKLSDGLVLNNTSIKVYGLKGSAEPVELTENTEYKLTRDDSGLGLPIPSDEGPITITFLLEFDYDKIANYDSVKVTYTATLDKTNSTVIGENGNKNIAYLDYSNNPYSESSSQKQESSNTVYTYGIEVSKIDKTSKAPLAGAEFTIIKADAVGLAVGETSNLYFVKTADGVYYLAESTDEGATTNLVVDSNGKLYLYGLDEGAYSLTETKAPDGYNKATTPIDIEIIDENLDGILDDEGATTGIYKLDFPNSTGFQLPITGGIGTTIFAASGIVFVGLGITLLVLVVRKNKNSNK